MIRWAGIVVLLLTSVAQANAPASSRRPVAREDVFPAALPSLAPERSLRPKKRSYAVQRRAQMAGAATTAVVATPKQTAPKPAAQPQMNSARSAVAPARDAEPIVSARRKGTKDSGIGKVCKDRKLKGAKVGKVPGKLNGCGIKKGAIKLYSVSGVTLSQPVVMECDTAKALKKWVEGGMDKSVGRYGGGVVELKVAAGYSCRTRNSRPGAKISEHGKGRAIDISGFELKNGNTISVLNDWSRGKKGRILKKMHKEACGPFGTVLGPKADRYHKDHFHFDVAKHRGGSYCR
ncbi:Uncharacterized conserved protein [Shimia gijangensis]|uniref:Uncharacterized conserved protein n=1 Tax=Shimia gijangensis TaxID=1470563 RepID=A0A1M6CPJ5_9RHOB|nr:extensin family protein [Shimia gijangensis]SHI62638.1 Uncharacterized conserved protein [Shimia gijangensis]